MLGGIPVRLLQRAELLAGARRRGAGPSLRLVTDAVGLGRRRYEGGGYCTCSSDGGDLGGEASESCDKPPDSLVWMGLCRPSALLPNGSACHDVAVDLRAAEDILREAGARFALVFGSQARGEGRPDSDVDVAAFFGAAPPNSFDILLPSAIDLLILDTAPLELAGRVALEGRLLFEDDHDLRIEWVARTRKVFLDERYRFERAHREFAASVTSRG